MPPESEYDGGDDYAEEEEEEDHYGDDEADGGNEEAYGGEQDYGYDAYGERPSPPPAAPPPAPPPPWRLHWRPRLACRAPGGAREAEGPKAA